MYSSFDVKVEPVSEYYLRLEDSEDVYSDVNNNPSLFYNGGELESVVPDTKDWAKDDMEETFESLLEKTNPYRNEVDPATAEREWVKAVANQIAAPQEFYTQQQQQQQLHQLNEDALSSTSTSSLVPSVENVASILIEGMGHEKKIEQPSQVASDVKDIRRVVRGSEDWNILMSCANKEFRTRVNRLKLSVAEIHDLKYERKKELNRLAAVRCRTKKMSEVSELNEKLTKLQSQYDQIYEERSALRKQVNDMRSSLQMAQKEMMKLKRQLQHESSLQHN